MPSLIDNIKSDMDWRIAELASLRTIPIRYTFTEAHLILTRRYFIPAIYSLWEGFVKSSLSSFIRHVSSEIDCIEDLSYNLLTHYIDTNCNFHNARTSFSSKLKVVKDLSILFTDNVSLPTSIPTESNVNYKVLCKLCDIFCMTPIDNKYKSALDKLLFFRNAVAHGDSAIMVSRRDVEDFTKLVEELMGELILKIEEAELTKSYRRISI